MKEIKHPGKIEKVSGERIWVKVERNSACGSCDARPHCCASDSRKENIQVKNSSREWRVGEEVWVTITRIWAGRAVLLAYIFPLLSMLLTLFITLALGIRELFAALFSLLALVLYYGILYRFKKQLHRKIHFSITLKD